MQVVGEVVLRRLGMEGGDDDAADGRRRKKEKGKDRERENKT